MRALAELPGVYALVGSMPEGCRLCMMGSKLVVFVTGFCSESCFYCPVSRERLGRDKVYADEERAYTLQDILDEAYRIGAEGASFTGGDPLETPSRVELVTRLLKDVFGPEFHIHLYTSGRRATVEALRGLEDAGVDEFRFHIVDAWGLERVEKAVKALRRARVGVELPVLPGSVEWLKKLLQRLERIGVEFVNLNELEASPSNIEALLVRGYRVSREKPIVHGSEEAARELLKWARENLERLTVHYCPAAYKDRVQVRLRLIRKALRTRHWFEEPTPHGTLVAAEPPGHRVEYYPLARRNQGGGLGAPSG